MAITDPVYKFLSINNRPVIPVDSGYYGTIAFDPDDSKPDYIGLHVSPQADVSSEDGWKVYKFTYNGNNVTKIQMAYGKWLDRATLQPWN
jgi:hypothetical protein